MSKLTNIQFSVKILLSFKKSIKLSISDVSWALLSIFKASGNNTFQQLIEHVLVREGGYTVKVLWEREKYWQAQLFTLTHGLNNMNEWYALNRRGYRK